MAVFAGWLMGRLCTLGVHQHRCSRDLLPFSLALLSQTAQSPHPALLCLTSVRPFSVDNTTIDVNRTSSRQTFTRMVDATVAGYEVTVAGYELAWGNKTIFFRPPSPDPSKTSANILEQEQRLFFFFFKK